MKKTMAYLLAVIMLLALSACQAPNPKPGDETKQVDEATTTTEETAEIEPVKLSEFIEDFKARLADNGLYELEHLTAVYDEEEKEFIHRFHIAEAAVTSRKSISVRCNLDNEISSVICDESKNITTAEITLLSWYIYKSMGFAKMGGEEFFGAFGLYDDEKEKSYYIEENGWELSMLYLESHVSFGVFKSDK